MPLDDNDKKQVGELVANTLSAEFAKRDAASKKTRDADVAGLSDRVGKTESAFAELQQKVSGILAPPTPKPKRPESALDVLFDD